MGPDALDYPLPRQTMSIGYTELSDLNLICDMTLLPTTIIGTTLVPADMCQDTGFISRRERIFMGSHSQEQCESKTLTCALTTRSFC